MVSCGVLEARDSLVTLEDAATYTCRRHKLFQLSESWLQGRARRQAFPTCTHI